MFKPYFAFIGHRYTRTKRRNHFISFISLTSMLGIALGVMVLITVISVMNGFSKEIRAQMLSTVPHANLKAVSGKLPNWQSVLQQLVVKEEIVGATPYAAAQAMLKANGRVQGGFIRGILPTQINEVYPLEENIIDGDLLALESGKYRVAIGKDLAIGLGVWLDDAITLIVPEATVTPVGVVPRMRRFHVAAIFETNTAYDNRHLFMNLADADKLLRLNGSVDGLQIRVKDELEANIIAEKIQQQVGPEFIVYDWMSEFGSFFKAIKMEKTVMWLILLLIIAVAAFNLVSSLVMVVTDKRNDIAILRTMGASRKSIMGIFMVQGSLIGIVGTVLGLVTGLLLAANVTELVAWIEQLIQIKFISEDVYFIGYVPSDIRRMDVTVICSCALIMSFIATLYPAWRATRIHPAEALRYE